MSHRTIGTCSICGGRVICPAGPIGYAGPLENLIRCESCGARKGNDGPIINMTRSPDDESDDVAKHIRDRVRRDADFARHFEAERRRLDMIGRSLSKPRRRRGVQAGVR